MEEKEKNTQSSEVDVLALVTVELELGEYSQMEEKLAQEMMKANLVEVSPVTSTLMLLQGAVAAEDLRQALADTEGKEDRNGTYTVAVEESEKEENNEENMDRREQSKPIYHWTVPTTTITGVKKKENLKSKIKEGEKGKKEIKKLNRNKPVDQGKGPVKN